MVAGKRLPLAVRPFLRSAETSGRGGRQRTENRSGRERFLLVRKALNRFRFVLMGVARYRNIDGFPAQGSWCSRTPEERAAHGPGPSGGRVRLRICC